MENKLHLSNSFSNYLENQPEQGMGFQIVNIELKNGKLLKERVILNSAYLKLNNNETIKNKDIKAIKIKTENNA